MILIACYIGFCLLCCSGLLALIHRERGDRRAPPLADEEVRDAAVVTPGHGRSSEIQPARKTTMETAA